MPIAPEPPGASDLYRTIVESQRRDAEKALEGGLSLAGALEIARVAAARLDWLLGRVATRAACKRGCHWCCRLQVEALPTEAVVLARFIIEQPRARRDALTKRIRAFDDRFYGRGQSARNELNATCPFLEDRACAVHPYRPLACRSWHSLSAEACRDGWRTRSASTVRVDGRRLMVRYLVDVGLMQALTGAGLAARQVELVAAVRLVLDSPDVVDRWLGGERAFAQAYAPEAPEWLSDQQRLIVAMMDDLRPGRTAPDPAEPAGRPGETPKM